MGGVAAVPKHHQKPTSGSIYIHDEDMKDVPTYKRSLSLMFQNYALLPHFNVSKNIAFGLRMRGYDKDKIESEVEEVMKLVGLEGLGDRFSRELSGGQQQRVALARSLVIKPRVLLLDEPMGNLDFKLQQRMMVELKQIHQKLGLTLLYVTHDREQAMSLSNRILVLNQGVIEQIGTPDEIYMQPNSVFVAKFVSDINMLRGEVASVSKGIATVKTGAGKFEGELKDRELHDKKLVYAVHPEKIYIGPVAKECPNRVEAKLLRQIYKGSDIQYVVELADGAEFRVLKQGHQIVDLRAQLGDQVLIGWDTEAALLLDKTSAVKGVDMESCLAD